MSLACWQTLFMHLLVTSSLSGGGPSVYWSDLLQFAMTGSLILVAGQLLVASLVLVCGPGGFWLRLAVYWGFMGWLMGTCAAGAILSDWLGRWLESLAAQSGWLIHDSYTTFTPGGAIPAAATLPIFLLAFQAPFWILRVVAGWRLQRTAGNLPTDSEHPAAESLSIRNLMEATAIVAVGLGLLQLADRFTAQAQRGNHLFSMLAGAGAITVCAFIVGLPLSGLFLRSVPLRVAWAITLATAVFCTAGFSVLILAANGGSEFWRALAGLFFGFLVLFGSQALALTILRQYGWRLVGRSRQATTHPA
jgi:hypothetical protein